MTRAAAVSGNPYEDMTDEQVLARAAGALRKVTTFPSAACSARFSGVSTRARSPSLTAGCSSWSSRRSGR